MIEKLTKEYLDDLLVRLAHHSSAIEGNTITLNQTVSIILNDTIPGSINKREFYEVENHKQAFEYIQHNLLNREKLSLGVIKEIHRLLLDHLDFNRGNFKNISNAIVGAEFDTASPEQTPNLMYQWLNNYEYLMENAETEEEKIRIILEKHIEFERIHPFNDGNGRTGRMIMLYSLLENNLPPIIISKELKPRYILGLAEQDTNLLYDLVQPLIDKEKDRMQKFQNKIS
ncbi:Fic family protein (plasmid) [Cetobacterium somerae]|uniref:Fic family protein n=1 Tax=Cetobacterium somerae TaxID=188913 RepID=UPI003D768C3E